MQRHPYHLVTPSPWPLLVALSVSSMALGMVGYLHYFVLGLPLFFLSMIILLCFLSLWFRDVIREGTFFGCHSENVLVGLRLGFLLFVVSEAMLFFSFFWAFFHSSLAPSWAIGSVWPPYGMEVFSPWGLPLLNTLILLTSGATITVAHLSIINNRQDFAVEAFALTILHALFFTAIQAYEYIHAPFSISDGIFGSVFFMLTGFHGFHVLLGTVFIAVQFSRYLKNHFTPQDHFGFTASAWYWHFVDLVWLLVFLVVYLWPKL